jgi:hypothetical protein
MKTAGHSAQFRRIVANRIPANYSKIVINDKNGTKPIYRNKGDIRIQKEKEVVSDKINWFHKGSTWPHTQCHPLRTQLW